MSKNEQQCTHALLEASRRRNETWSPPNLLPDPYPKDGWTFKWVRISTQGQDDPTIIVRN